METNKSIDPMRKVSWRAHPSRPYDMTWTFIHIKFSDGSGKIERYCGRLQPSELGEFIPSVTFAKNVTVTKMRYFKFDEEILMNVTI